MRLWLVIGLFLTATRAFTDVSVVATVDRSHIAFGESVTFKITIQGASAIAEPSTPSVDGLQFAYAGQSMNTIMQLGGPTSQSVTLDYQVTPVRAGEFVIPAVQVNVSGKAYHTEPIKLVVEKGAVPNEWSQRLFVRVQPASQQVYLGQVSPVNVLVFVRRDLPFHKLSGFQAEAEGLNYGYRDKVKQGSQEIEGEAFSFYVIEGAIAPTRVGTMQFGPAIVKCQLRVPRRGDDIIRQFLNQVEVQEVTVPVDPVPIEVLPLPEEGRPADFAGAIGQWNLEVTAKPTEVAVGDPITVTIKVSGSGNIDTVPSPKLGPLDGFKTYDPTTKTTKNDLNTTGERAIQQVLMAKNTDVKELPEVRLVYFDPVAKAYRTAVQSAIKLVVKAGSGTESTIVGNTGGRLRPEEKLGQDIVYLKGDLGPAAPLVPFCATPAFWVLNVMPVLGLVGGIGWKRRADRLRGDVAYARRTRAAKNARRLLATAMNYDEVQRALQQYLGDRLNIPAAGITASIVDEQLVPRGVNGELATRARECFENCDTARFAGGSAGTDVRATREQVERLIDELEKKLL